MGFEIEVKIKALTDEEVKEEKQRLSISSEAVTKAGIDVLMRKLGY